MLTVALFIMVKNWRQPKWFSAEKQLKEIWYINTIKYHVILKENGVGQHELIEQEGKC